MSLTDTGRQLISEVLPQHIQAIVEEMSVLTPEEQETLSRLCRKLGKQERQPLAEHIHAEELKEQVG